MPRVLRSPSEPKSESMGSMNVSPNALRKETVETLKEVDKTIDMAKRNVAPGPVRPEVIGPLLLAKAQCLNTLTLLNEKR